MRCPRLQEGDSFPIKLEVYIFCPFLTIGMGMLTMRLLQILLSLNWTRLSVGTCSWTPGSEHPPWCSKRRRLSAASRPTLSGYFPWSGFFVHGKKKIPPSLLRNLILLGDFMNAIYEYYSLKQIVSQPTHFSHLCTPSTIDLVFIPSDCPLTCVVLPPLFTSDHNTSCFPTNHPAPSSYPSSFHWVWQYDLADFDNANEVLASVPWDSILPFFDAESSWKSCS